jgi:hypothetical protein
MADATGIKAKAAFKKDRGLYGAGPAITYPDVPGGTDMAAGHGVPFSADSINAATERQEDTSLTGGGGAPPSERISNIPGGSLEGRLRYRGWERLMAIAMGMENAVTGTASPETVVSGAYRHLLEQDQDLQDEGWLAGERTGGSANDRKVRRGQLGLAKQVSDWVWYSCMVQKMSIVGSPQGVDISFDLVGYDKVTGSYNSASWTVPSGSIAQALFQSAVVKLGLAAGGAGSTVEQAVSGFEITVENSLKGDDQTTTSGQNIIIPLRQTMRKTTLKLDYPRYNAATLHTYDDLDSELMASIEFTGPIITGATPYEIAFFFSSLRTRVDDGSPVGGPGPLGMSFEWDAHRPASDLWQATKYPNITPVENSEMTLMLVNDDTQNYLTEV